MWVTRALQGATSTVLVGSIGPVTSEALREAGLAFSAEGTTTLDEVVRETILEA